jgi:hypothetical protein
MTIALWIIAACEIIRAVQNFVQLSAVRKDTAARDNAYAEFVKSLHQSDKEFVKRILEEFEEEHENGEGQMGAMGQTHGKGVVTGDPE